jgi:hypothetical protein
MRMYGYVLAHSERRVLNEKAPASEGGRYNRVKRLALEAGFEEEGGVGFGRHDH